MLFTCHNTTHINLGNEQCLKLLLGVCNTKKKGRSLFFSAITQLCHSVFSLAISYFIATAAVFASYLSSLYILTNTVSPIRACLSIWLERLRGSQKEDER